MSLIQLEMLEYEKKTQSSTLYVEDMQRTSIKMNNDNVPIIVN